MQAYACGICSERPERSERSERSGNFRQTLRRAERHQIRSELYISL